MTTPPIVEMTADHFGHTSAGHPCPDCRIELAGPCPTCEVRHRWCGLDGKPRCDSYGTVTVAHGYAVGQPLPILDGTITHAACPPDCLFTTGTGEMVHDADFEDESITAAIAHYGPPDTLVGKWALHLEGVTR